MAATGGRPRSQSFDGETMRGWETILREQRKWWSDKNAGIRFSKQRPPEMVQQGAGVVTPEGWRIVLAHESLVRSLPSRDRRFFMGG